MCEYFNIIVRILLESHEPYLYKNYLKLTFSHYFTFLWVCLVPLRPRKGCLQQKSHFFEQDGFGSMNHPHDLQIIHPSQSILNVIISFNYFKVTVNHT